MSSSSFNLEEQIGPLSSSVEDLENLVYPDMKITFKNRSNIKDIKWVRHVNGISALYKIEKENCLIEENDNFISLDPGIIINKYKSFIISIKPEMILKTRVIDGNLDKGYKLNIDYSNNRTQLDFNIVVNKASMELEYNIDEHIFTIKIGKVNDKTEQNNNK